MSGYSDFSMIDGNGETVAGVCHARGSNKDLPRQWLLYVAVSGVDASVKACEERGGQVIDGPRAMGKSRSCVVKDPQGAVLALIQD